MVYCGREIDMRNLHWNVNALRDDDNGLFGLVVASGSGDKLRYEWSVWTTGRTDTETSKSRGSAKNEGRARKALEKAATDRGYKIVARSPLVSSQVITTFHETSLAKRRRLRRSP